MMIKMIGCIKKNKEAKKNLFALAKDDSSSVEDFKDQVDLMSENNKQMKKEIIKVSLLVVTGTVAVVAAMYALGAAGVIVAPKLVKKVSKCVK